MTTHGTAFSDGQICALAGRLTTALPKALRLAAQDYPELDIKAALRYTEEGERTALALAEMFRLLYNGSGALIPRLIFSSVGKTTLPLPRGKTSVVTTFEASTSWTVASFVLALLNVPSSQSRHEAASILRERGYVLTHEEIKVLMAVMSSGVPDLSGGVLVFRDDRESTSEAFFSPPGSQHLRLVTNWHEVRSPQQRIIIAHFDPSRSQIRPPV